MLGRPLKRARFDLYALGSWRSLARLMSEELQHWSDHEERVLGFTVEATTVSPSTKGVLADHPDPQTPEEMTAFLAEYPAMMN